MGMYTELVFQGYTKHDLPQETQELFYYFFNEDSSELIGDFKTPDHEFFQCDRWRQIGRMSSYYFIPFALRNMTEHVRSNEGNYVFLRCDLKNYNSEIEKFLDWIKPYMEKCWGYYWYEEDESPVIFKA